MNRPFVVTVKHGDEARTRIWRGKEPFAIGHPFRWVLEREGPGVRIRDLAGSKGAGAQGSVSYVEPEVVESGMSVLLPNSKAAVRIRPAASLAPAFESRPNPNGNIQVYCCMGNWSLGSQPVGNRYSGQVREQNVFEIVKAAGGYLLSAVVPGIFVETPHGKLELAESETRSFSAQEIGHLTVRFGSMNWVFSSIENVAIPVLTARNTDPQHSEFKKALGLSGIALALLGLVAVIWPAPSPDLVIQPQQVTIQLEKKLRKITAAPSAARGGGKTKPAENRKPAVVQAFRAQALSSAMNGLMKGGMTKLMKDSDFMAGSDQSLAARSIMSKGSKQLLSTAPVTGPMGARSITVASIGGGTLGGNGTGTGVGYGSGDHATVGGQGKSFVSLDTGASDVDEGLSKEEVGAVIHRHLSEVRYCYESAMIRNPSVEGKLVVGFTIGGGGNVRSADIKDSSLSEASLGDCVLRRLSTWKFPRTKGGINVSVSYPFIFKSLGR